MLLWCLYRLLAAASCFNLVSRVEKEKRLREIGDILYIRHDEPLTGRYPPWPTTLWSLLWETHEWNNLSSILYYITIFYTIAYVFRHSVTTQSQVESFLLFSSSGKHVVLWCVFLCLRLHSHPLNTWPLVLSSGQQCSGTWGRGWDSKAVLAVRMCSITPCRQRNIHVFTIWSVKKKPTNENCKIYSSFT